MQDKLRQEVRLLKALQNISYKEIAKRLEISANGFYNFMEGYYSLSAKNADRLKEIIKELKQC